MMSDDNSTRRPPAKSRSAGRVASPLELEAPTGRIDGRSASSPQPGPPRSTAPLASAEQAQHPAQKASLPHGSPSPAQQASAHRVQPTVQYGGQQSAHRPSSPQEPEPALAADVTNASERELSAEPSYSQGMAREGARTMILSTSNMGGIVVGGLQEAVRVRERHQHQLARNTLPYVPSTGETELSDTSQPEVVIKPPRELSVGSEVVAVGRPPPVKIHQLQLPPPAAGRRLVMVTAPDSSQAALYRVLRRRLIERISGKCIMVSSAERGSGKTTCAVNLALAFAEGGRARVLLLEAHLRAPALAELLQIQPPECFAAQLAHVVPGEDRLWHVVTIGSPWLHVLAVSPDADPRSINRALFEAGLEQLRRIGYDYIVIDAPPVLGTADTLLIEDLADGVLLTTLARRSRAAQLRNAIEQLSPEKIAGVALLDA